MYIEEVKEGELESGEEYHSGESCHHTIAVSDAKKALVGAGARALFYPTLLYNVVRNKIQSEFRWWDRVDEFILLGAVPFPADVPRLKALGVAGVVTLNEPYETLVPTSLYHDHDINHLVIPTRDYLFAPSYCDICQAVDFIHGNASHGKMTYVHCKAGRGRSTTIVLCYLVKHKHMTPEAAYTYVRSIRPRVLLASSQWQAVEQFYHRVSPSPRASHAENSLTLSFIAEEQLEELDDNPVTTEEDLENLDDNSVAVDEELEEFDDGSVVLVTESDLDGYDETLDSDMAGKNMLGELKLTCKVQFARQAAVARLSCLWPRYHAGQKDSRKKLGSSISNSQLESSIGVDIHVY